MAERDLTGAVDFAYLERFAMNDAQVIGEVLELFAGEGAVWRGRLRAEAPDWRDTVHTIKGAARGIGALALGDACEAAEAQGPDALPQVRAALEGALADIAAYRRNR